MDARLTPHEREVLIVAANGRGYREVGQALGITEHTVKNEVSAVLQRIGAANLIEAYWRLGWLRPDR